MAYEQEPFTSPRAAEFRLKAARVALFDVCVDYALSGHCTMAEALAEFEYENDLLTTGGVPAPSPEQTPSTTSRS